MINKQPKISIITACYNAKSTIADTISSIAEQQYPNIEHIIIDGASTDGTLDIIKQHQNSISKYISEPDDGIYHAMNKGISIASGDIIGLLNADDIYAHNQVITKVVDIFSNNNVDACFADLKYYCPNLSQVKRYWRSQQFVPGSFAKGWCPAHPTFFVKNYIYQRCGMFDTSMPIANDVELMMRFLEKYKINSYYHRDVWVKMRMGGVSNRSIKNILQQNHEIIKAGQRLGLKMSISKFAFNKIINRASQFYHPKRELI